MKKIIALICFLFLCLPVFAEYKPIPAYLSKQYKTEMESIINNNYSKALANIDEYYNEVEKTSIEPEISIYDVNLFLYADMMKVTQEKYLGIKYEPYGTDSYVSAAEFLAPYFEDNHINIKKIVNISKYARNKDIALDKYRERKLY